MELLVDAPMDSSWREGPSTFTLYLTSERNAARSKKPHGHPGPLSPEVSASNDVVKKIVPEGTGWVTGSTAYGGTIAQNFSKIKNYESMTFRHAAMGRGCGLIRALQLSAGCPQAGVLRAGLNQ